ncbi:MAG: hypothetical protein UH963_00330 [Agathobacter sp.]|nr:hypothetical protein [Agathobacter sp.]
MNSNLSKTISNISYASKMYDNVIKELFADKQILANILKYTLDEFKDMSIPDIISEMGEPSISNIQVDPGCTNTGSGGKQNSTESIKRVNSNTGNTGTVSSYAGKIQKTSEEDIVIGEGKIVYDIRFIVYHGDEKIKILINIEAQNISKASGLGYDLDNRIIYYLCRMISSQKEVEFTHSNYDDIKAVRSIWICLDGKENEDSINRIELTTKNIFGKKSKFNNINKLQAVIIKLREIQNVEVSKNRLIAMLEELVSKDDTEIKKKKLSEKYNLVMDDNLERRVSSMCNFSEALIERGREEGRMEGHLIGLEEGRLKGQERERARGVIKNITNMQSYDLSKDQIMKFLNIPEETYLNILNLINTYPDYTVDELADEYVKIISSDSADNGDN